MVDVESGQGSSTPTGPATNNIEDANNDRTSDGTNKETQQPSSETKQSEDNIVVLSFWRLQLQRIVELQDELLQLATLAAGDSPVPEGHSKMTDELLATYSQALRNYETLSANALDKLLPGTTLVGALAKSSLVPPELPLLWKILRKLFPTLTLSLQDFSSTYWHAFRSVFDSMEKLYLYFPYLDFIAIRVVWGCVSIVLKWVVTPSRRPKEMIEQVAESQGFRELDKEGQQQRAQKSASIERIVMAVFGGLALIGPMLVMTLHPSRDTSLITVSVAVFIFAIFLALGATSSSGKDILAATAAYAAVLVVFVGTSSSSSA